MRKPAILENLPVSSDFDTEEAELSPLQALPVKALAAVAVFLVTIAARSIFGS